MKKDFVFTSESVTEGHPDKLCDQISDAIVDAFLTADPYARVVAECAVANGVVFIAARFGSNARIDIPEVARRVIREVGYRDGEFNADDCTILTSLRDLGEQPPVADEAAMDDPALDRITAKEPVTVFGYACDQTPSLMPLPIVLAHRLARRLAAVRLQNQLPYLSPDAKTQVSVAFRDRRPVRIHGVALSAYQLEGREQSLERLRADLREWVVDPVFAHEDLRPDAETRVFINPDGALVGGGPGAHAGLTGRKTAIDTYGEYARHSGSALSGKEPVRIDRVAAYAARHAAKNLVAAGLARECEVQLSYTIGLPGPVSLQVDTHGSGSVDDQTLAERLLQSYDFRLGGIVRRFDLRRMPALHRGGFYRKLAAYGQVGRMDIGLPWEQTDQAATLR